MAADRSARAAEPPRQRGCAASSACIRCSPTAARLSAAAARRSAAPVRASSAANSDRRRPVSVTAASSASPSAGRPPAALSAAARGDRGTKGACGAADGAPARIPATPAVGTPHAGTASCPPSAAAGTSAARGAGPALAPAVPRPSARHGPPARRATSSASGTVPATPARVPPRPRTDATLSALHHRRTAKSDTPTASPGALKVAPQRRRSTAWWESLSRPSLGLLPRSAGPKWTVHETGERPPWPARHPASPGRPPGGAHASVTPASRRNTTGKCSPERTSPGCTSTNCPITCEPAGS